MARKTRPATTGPTPPIEARLREREVLAALRRLRRGELDVRLPDVHEGVDGQVCEAFNDLAELVQAFAGELAGLREAVAEGQTRRRLAVDGLRGEWKRCVGAVNGTLDALQGRADEATQVLAAAASGDFTPRIDEAPLRGEFARQARAVNRVLDHLQALCGELTRVAREVGLEGKLGTRAALRGMRGGWKELADAVNLIAASLTVQVREIARVTTAIARGDLGKTIDIEVRGEILELKTTINAVVEQLGSLTAEVTRVAQEVSDDGRLGGHADVPGVSGVWRELVDQVNLLASSLTDQVRDMAEVTTAVAHGDLSRKVTVDARGEILVVKTTVNTMVDQLAVFAAEITRIGREVATEGLLGGQVQVRGVSGIWQDIVDNVNFLARNLATQVRAIAHVVTAVARGDLQQKLNVEARGEIGALIHNVNHMIRTLAETTRVNHEQDWLKTHLTRLTRMLQGQRDLLTVAGSVLSEIAPAVGAQVGVFYLVRRGEQAGLRALASYALAQRPPRDLALGEGLAGQVALERRRLLLTEVPPDFLTIETGLGRGRPASVVVSPVLFEGEVKAVVELGALQPYSAIQLAFLDQFFESLGIVIASIEAQERTDELLRRSQELAEELRSQQEELRHTNDELERKARQLFEQKSEVERKNQEIELARRELEEKAEALALTSSYKSQFLATMSHELRTPLNSLLLLSRQLAENPRGNLDDKQVLYARTIHQAGSDLLELINEILDLVRSKHDRKMHVDLREVAIEELRDHVERMFRHVAEDRRLAFTIEVDPALPATLISDEKRIKQVLRNLLSNAFKFTERGSVQLTIAPARPGSPDEGLIAFAVKDTGIGVSPHQQQLIFEAFQQADGDTNRKYGGTGLGLAISREIALRLGGDLRVESRPGAGSTFTLYLPRVCPTEPGAAPNEPTPAKTAAEPPALRPSPAAERTGEREQVRPDQRVLLLVTSDAGLARTLAALAVPRGFGSATAGDGATTLDLAHKHPPDALILDLELPDVDGWVLLDRLKHDPRLRQIPVYVLAGAADDLRARTAGALGVLPRPIDADVFLAALADLQSFLLRPRQLLIVGGDPARRRGWLEPVAAGLVAATAVPIADALAVLARDPYDCVLVDGAGHDGLELLDALASRPELRRTPFVVAVGRVDARDPRWTRLQTKLPITPVAEPDLLLAELTLHLHCPVDALPPAARDTLTRALLRAPTLADRKVLVVDDDVRNIFTLTAVLEHYGMRVVYAENGQQALERLTEHRDVELVLMDIMMPEMDGYEATRRIRARSELAKLPIIALTAKAMLGDRENCVRAGASDYITKPVDPDQLVSLLRVTLGR